MVDDRVSHHVFLWETARRERTVWHLLKVKEYFFTADGTQDQHDTCNLEPRSLVEGQTFLIGEVSTRTVVANVHLY